MRSIRNLARVTHNGLLRMPGGEDCLTLGGSGNISPLGERAERFVVGGRVHVQMDGLVRDRQINGVTLMVREQRGEWPRCVVLRRLGQNVSRDKRRMPATPRKDRIDDAA